VVVDAAITELGIGTASNPGAEYEPAVGFASGYGGTQYAGTQLSPAGIERDDETQAAAGSAVEGYERGTGATVSVEPDEPGGAFPKDEPTAAPLVLIGVGGSFALRSAVSTVRKR
jgi:hypothetical protein